ncbi:MAG: response regulator transcription factor [Alphaproteobacteria bacterium]|nr:response regulator transcription factor [Alphaproteobacteria bacterium]MBF0393236.1 response regulator transcription factor [Alphaproteobacteria bacterium]
MKIILADDHRLVRDGLKPFLEELGGGVEVVDAATADEALAAAGQGRAPGLILLDLNMPGMNGLAGLARLRACRPDVPIVILSGDVSRALVTEAVQAGAAGYIPKTIGGPGLVNALRLVLGGETYLPPCALNDDPPPVAAPASGLALLSDRERQVLGLLIQGLTNKEIARQLDLAEITIKIHLRNVYRKIGAANRAQAVRIAMTAGWPA